MPVNFRDRKSEQGMTLVELIIVVVIIAMLVAALGLGVRGKFGKAKEKIARIEISKIDGALQLYMFEVGTYPSEGEGLEVLRRNPGNLSSWNGPYLQKDPKDPWGRPYVYRFPGTHDTDFDLYSLGADGIEGTEDDVGNWE